MLGNYITRYCLKLLDTYQIEIYIFIIKVNLYILQMANLNLWVLLKWVILKGYFY